MEIAVAGTGYVGLVTGVVLANIGHNVTCVDVDLKKIEMMRNCISPIYETGLEELMKKNKERLSYTTDYKTAYANAEVIFIGVGTPENIDGSANLDNVYNVCKQIAESVTKDCVVVIKSTVPIGTNDDIEKFLRDNVNSNINIYVASNPEFLSQGTAVHDTLYASRIVVGIESGHSKKIMHDLYKPLTIEPYNVPFLSMNRRSAEMVKYASNDFLALKISYVNEIANLCEELHANIEDVTLGMGMDQRIGNKFLNAGIGYGGSCFPKDTKALHWLSFKNNCEMKTVKACVDVNKDQKVRLFNSFKKTFGEIKNLNVAVLGATFKPGTDDLRESPAIDNVKLLIENNVNVTIYDPIGLNNFKKLFGDKIKYEEDIYDAIKDKDAILIMTDWDEIKKIDINKIEELMKTPFVFDGRNCFSLDKFLNTKIFYKSIGRVTINENLSLKF